MLDGDLAVNATVDANSRTVHLSADIPLEVVPCMRFATLPLLEETTVSDGGGDGP